LAFLIDENELDFAPFHRLVKDKNGLSAKQLVERIGKSFDVERTDKSAPTEHSEMVMILGDENYSLLPKYGLVDKNHPVKSLSTQILTDYILEPILDIQDQKTSDRIEFVSGESGLSKTLNKAKQYVDSVVFVLSPLAISEVKSVADAHMIMPPKSTWVEPKLRSGLTIYAFENAD
jgi:uncharacterized protein (DUF1015 family)